MNKILKQILFLYLLVCCCLGVGIKILIYIIEGVYPIFPNILDALGLIILGLILLYKTLINILEVNRCLFSIK